jgi:hypothetical protein
VPKARISSSHSTKAEAEVQAEIDAEVERPILVERWRELVALSSH